MRRSSVQKSGSVQTTSSGHTLNRSAEAFVEQLATFALRRVMTIDDAAQIKAITKASEHDNYRLKPVLEHLVM